MPPAELYATYRYTQLYIDKILSELNAAVLVNGFRLRSAIAVVELCMVYFINRKTIAVFLDVWYIVVVLTLTNGHNG